ncbi:MAG: VOC family protein [Candidatus Hodarchaeota archaeon]
MGNRLLKIDSIMYFTNDLEKSARFYKEILGLHHAWNDAKNRMIGLKFSESEAEIVLHTDTSLPNPNPSYLVENVEHFCSWYRSKGHTIDLEPIEVRCGKYAVLFDPDGNKIPIIDLSKFDGKPQYNTLK